jgi:hypothetical protein
MKHSLLLALLCLAHGFAIAADKPNVLILTVDDMSCDSIGVFGCRLAGTTPRIDRFAEQAMRFSYAHTVVGNCMPSRNVMWSGRYPHNNRVEGFKSVARAQADYPVLGDLMKAGGWFTGIRHKVSHSTPYAPFPWDLDLDRDAVGAKPPVKDPPTYGAALRQGMEAARKAGKPFCLMLNVADPHKPFYSEGARGQTVDDPHKPSRVFAPEEVPVPGFLPDDPVIRQELAQYYSSVRRADDAVGSILDALQASGEDERTVILFLFDHRVPEEAYQVKYDADALENLIAEPKHATEVAALEKALEEWMVRTHDPLLEAFRQRDDAAFRETAIQQIEEQTVLRKKRAAAKASAPASNTTTKARREAANLIQLETPTTIVPGGPAKIKIKHHFPDDLGERPIQVTLKGGNNARLERKTVKAAGTGEIEVTFDLPAEIPGGAVIFAGLVGDSIKDALQHVQTKPIHVR